MRIKIYLASKSPRRQELLSLMGQDFEILLQDVPEEPRMQESALEYSKRVTTEKLLAAWQKIQNEHLLEWPVLCADTEVVLDGQILGKPDSPEHAFNMLKQYGEKTHQVITTLGILYRDYMRIQTNVTEVSFANIPDQDIKHYLSMNQYQDKSGAYGIQSYIGQFITKINGCFYSVMGLPLHTLRQLLDDVKPYLFTIYHHPNCSKSKAALDILHKRGILAYVHDYQKYPLSRRQLQELMQYIDFKDIIRTTGCQDQESAIALLLKDPSLMQRPILSFQNSAIIARDPQALMSWLDALQK